MVSRRLVQGQLGVACMHVGGEEATGEVCFWTIWAWVFLHQLGDGTGHGLSGMTVLGAGG